MATRVDLDELLLNVDPAKVLEALELREGIDFQIHGAILRGRCPAHMGDNFNFAIKLDTGLCSCYSHKCFHPLGRSIASVLAYRFGWAKTFEILQAVADAHPVKVYTGGYEYRIPTEGEVKNLRRNESDYLIRRGITQHTLDMFDCGFHPGDPEKGHPGRVTIPIRNADHSLLGILGRRVDGAADKKYYPLTGYFPSGRTLFGLSHVLRAGVHQGSFVLIEGPVSTLKAWELGSQNAMGVMGSSLSWDQAELLANEGEEVTVIEENDEAGRAFVKNVFQKLGSTMAVYRVRLPANVTGVDDLTDMDDWFECLDARELVRRV